MNTYEPNQILDFILWKQTNQLPIFELRIGVLEQEFSNRFKKFPSHV